MNIVDLIIIVGIVLSIIMGFIRGFFRETLIFLGTMLVVILGFIVKNPLSQIMYQNFKFFKFGGLTSLNIVVYEIIAFLVAVTVLSLILAIILKVTGLISKILSSTVILALPSKLLGALVGFIQGVVICYAILFVLSLPVLRIPYIGESKYANLILNKTPIVHNITDNIVSSFNEVKEFTKKDINLKDVKGTNRKIVEILLKNKVVTTDSIEILINNKKIEIDNSNELIEKYKEA